MLGHVYNDVEVLNHLCREDYEQKRWYKAENYASELNQLLESARQYRTEIKTTPVIFNDVSTQEKGLKDVLLKSTLLLQEIDAE
ncbi:hypothetical protein [Desulfitobacterium metallireducens]|uniref:Uncharacterized protein n=1 Tax=Desulfitobacterium metallireducens DSM 15288 TaxID=871968 RepID=W0E9U5_9FIRM|nr:hypothetical protein [Desulfitobacterium metallireducens]AHF05821.1 hypothetical protein DESME_00995 [Desulfitobacterium metallireducens DSM 15288]